ncbi:restriction endonuclease subunit S [Ketobacter sp. MCCC 1A13808]|uniref:restriction endonuclease subunit S n=1 Tax=Ketobacter sp. MCCC 1A13808 TaxID=2602738 RepID=UPI0012EC1CC9|nr:restriction endonuclease subunit S [Ketobacter sp. MCCC 1A13808]MVF12343.1 restriction endonuclease subunit S [Ketobacter sp. MCCC 1A13808]
MKLKQVATINAGYPFRGKIPDVAGSAVVAVQMKDVSLTEGIRWSSCLETELTGKREPDYLATGDILVAARGSHNYAVHVDESLALTGKQAIAAPHFFVISLKKKDILPEFMVWLLNQTPAQRYFEQNAEGTLTKSIRRSALEDVPVVVPPLAKQRAIIAMASTLGEEQRLIQKLANNGERMMGAIANDLYQTHGH